MQEKKDDQFSGTHCVAVVQSTDFAAKTVKRTGFDSRWSSTN